MLGNIYASLTKTNENEYTTTNNTYNILSVMNILYNKLNFNNKNIINTFNKIYNKEKKNINEYITDNNILPYLLSDIGYFARDSKEIEKLIKLFYKELNLDFKGSNSLYNDTLVIASIINMLKRGIKITEIVHYFNEHSKEVTDKTYNAFFSFVTTDSFIEVLEKVKDEDEYTKGIALSLAEIRFKYVPNDIYLLLINDVDGLSNRDITLETFKDYLEDRDYSFVNYEDINEDTMFLIVENKSEDGKITREYYHSNKLQSFANFIVYEDMPIFNKLFTDDYLDDIMETRDYNSFIYTIKELYYPDEVHEKILEELLVELPYFLKTSDISSFKYTLDKLNILGDNKSTYYKYKLITTPYDTIKYISENDKDNLILNELLKF